MASKICHIEIAVTDIVAAKKFYADVFGWKFTMSGPHYAIFETGDGVGGGLNSADKHLPDGPIRIYIAVEDIPATLAKIAQAGGRPEQAKTEIGGGYGFMATFRDPAGNLIALWARQ